MIYTLHGKPTTIPHDIRQQLESQCIVGFESNPVVSG